MNADSPRPSVEFATASEESEVVGSEVMGSLVGGAMDYLVRNVGGGVVKTMAGIASGITSATTLEETSGISDSPLSHDSRWNIPSGEQLRGECCAVVEYSCPEIIDENMKDHDEEEAKLSLHISTHEPSLGVHIPSTLMMMNQLFCRESVDVTSRICTLRFEQMCFESSSEEHLLDFIKLHKNTVDAEKCLFAVSRQVPSSALLIYNVFRLIAEQDDSTTGSVVSLQNVLRLYRG